MSIVVVLEVLVIVVVEVAIVVVFGVVIVYIKPSWQALTTPPPLSGNAHIWKQRISKRGLPYVEFFFPAFLSPVARVTLIKSPSISKHFSFFPSMMMMITGSNDSC